MEAVLQLLQNYKYAAMFGILFCCGMGLPIPEEVTLLGSGLAVGWGQADYLLASTFCVLGILAGDSIIFSLGRYCGRWFLSCRPMRWVLPEGRQHRVERLFARHGSKTVFVARFMPGVRIGVYAYAEQHGMGGVRFLALDLLGAMISGPTSIFVGKIAAEKWADPAQAEAYAKQLLKRGNYWLGMILLGLVFLGFLHWLWTKRSERRALEKEAAELLARESPGGVPNSSAPSCCAPTRDTRSCDTPARGTPSCCREGAVAAAESQENS